MPIDLAWREILDTVLIARLASAVAIALIAIFVAGRLRSAAARALARGRADANTQLLLARTTYVLVLAIAAAWILDLLNIGFGGILATFGVAGLTLSLAAQDLLRNVLAGAYLLVERPFRIGDRVAVKDHEGVVEDVQLRTTVLRTDDHRQILIPNATMFAEIVVNKSVYEPSSPQPADKQAFKQS